MQNVVTIIELYFLVNDLKVACTMITQVFLYKDYLYAIENVDSVLSPFNSITLSSSMIEY